MAGDCHKMKAFVPFRKLEKGIPNASDTHNFIAWFEPEHLIVPHIAPFFQNRFKNMNWSILTPDCSVHWNQKKLAFSPGVTPKIDLDSDAFENLWLIYYKNIFNPARLKEKAMQSEMQKKY